MVEDQAAKTTQWKIVCLIAAIGLLFLACIVVISGFFLYFIVSRVRSQMLPTEVIVRNTPVSYQNADGLKLCAPNAKVMIDVFDDFKCEACETYSKIVEPLVVNRLVNTGKACYIFHNYPFLDDHTQEKESDIASHAAMCAAEQDRFWDFKDLLFANLYISPGIFTDSRMEAFAGTLEMDMGQFKQCLTLRRYQAEIEADIELAKQWDVQGVPSVFVNRRVISPGYLPTFEKINAAVEEALQE